MPMIGDYTEQQHADMLHRDRARAMAEAIDAYANHMHGAVRASLIHGDDASADRSRAMARESLHMFPALLAMVEPPLDTEHGQRCHDCQTVGRNPCAICPEVEPILDLVERVGEYTR